MSAEALVHLLDCVDEQHAALAQTALRAEGIESHIQAGHHGALLSMLGGGVTTSLWVKEAELERATVLLDALARTPPDYASDEPPPARSERGRKAVAWTMLAFFAGPPVLAGLYWLYRAVAG